MHGPLTPAASVYFAIPWGRLNTTTHLKVASLVSRIGDRTGNRGGEGEGGRAGAAQPQQRCCRSSWPGGPPSSTVVSPGVTSPTYNVGAIRTHDCPLSLKLL